jgi:hypothetical protein
VKPVKLFSAATLAAIAAMALVGAPSAMAEGSTAACKVNETPCSAGNLFTGKAEGIGENVLLLSSVLTVTCAKSKIAGTILELAKPLIAHLELFSFEECKTNSGTPCKVVPIKLGLIEVLRTGPNVGTATSDGGTEELIQCGSFIHCVYGGKPSLKIEGGEHPSVKAIGAALEGTGGFFCPKEASYDALYKLTSPLSLYVSS